MQKEQTGSFIRYNRDGASSSPPFPFLDHEGKRTVIHPEKNIDGFDVYTGPMTAVKKAVSVGESFYYLWKTESVVCSVEDPGSGSVKQKRYHPMKYTRNGMDIEWSRDNDFEACKVSQEIGEQKSSASESDATLAMITRSIANIREQIEKIKGSSTVGHGDAVEEVIAGVNRRHDHLAGRVNKSDTRLDFLEKAVAKIQEKLEELAPKPKNTLPPKSVRNKKQLDETGKEDGAS